MQILYPTGLNEGIWEIKSAFILKIRPKSAKTEQNDWTMTFGLGGNYNNQFCHQLYRWQHKLLYPGLDVSKFV